MSRNNEWTKLCTYDSKYSQWYFIWSTQLSYLGAYFSFYLNITFNKPTLTSTLLMTLAIKIARPFVAFVKNIIHNDVPFQNRTAGCRAE
jgi:uncharacterized membrane protein (DUF485 family)